MGLSKQEAQDPHSVRAQCTQPAAGQQAVDSRGTAPRCQPPVDRLTVQSISPLIPCGPAGSWLTVQRVNLRAPDLPRCAASASAARSGVPPPCSRHILFSDFCFCTGSGRCSCRAMSLHFPGHRAEGAKVPKAAKEICRCLSTSELRPVARCLSFLESLILRYVRAQKRVCAKSERV